jgi:hypothetical protein
MLKLSRIGFAAVVAIALAVPMHLHGQDIQTAELKLGSIVGTVTDVNGHPVSNATVLLKRTHILLRTKKGTY